MKLTGGSSCVQSRQIWFLVVCLFLLPSQAFAQMGNTKPQVQLFSVSASPAPAGGVVSVSCTGHDPDGVIKKITFQVDGGVFTSNGVSTIAVDVVPNSQDATVEVDWNVPTTAGTNVTVTCTVWDNGGFMPNTSGSTSVTLLVPVSSASPPQIVSLLAKPNELFPNESSTITATVTDVAGGGLTYVWQTSAGVLTGDTDADPEVVTLTAPSTPGPCVVTLNVTDIDSVRASKTLVVGVLPAKTAGLASSGAVTLVYPERVDASPNGEFAVTDARQKAVLHFSPLGTLMRVIQVGRAPSGVALAPDGRVYVGDRAGKNVAVFDSVGLQAATLSGPYGAPMLPIDLAIATLTGSVYVLDGEGMAVQSFAADNSPRGTLTLPVGMVPSAIAVDAFGTLLYLLDGKGGKVHVYTTEGVPVRVVSTFGEGTGQLKQPTGVSADAAGNLYVVDAYQAHVSVFNNLGVFQGVVGGYGVGSGQFRIPTDVATTWTGRMVVSDTNNQRVGLFDLPGSGPVVCPNDADCDGLPDVWELAHALNPNSPSDAFLDTDHDGLINREELAASTDPNLADSDADGVEDGTELSQGFDPIDATDQKPSVSTQTQRTTLPTVISLLANANDPNNDPLTVEWSQIDGPSSPLVSGDAPIFPLRAAGQYHFSVRVSDGKVWSEPSSVQVEILQAAPNADAGPDFGGVVDAAVQLEGQFSVDANGDTLSYAWTQEEGPAAVLSDANVPNPTFVPTESGTYLFALTVDDGVSSTVDRVFVSVDRADDHVPVAVLPESLVASAGETVTLDASSSVDTDGDPLSFTWTQLDGVAVTLAINGATASFSAADAGLSRFQVVANDGLHSSRPALITVVIDAANGALPRANAGDDRRIEVGNVLDLDCSPSVGATDCSWTQLVGTTLPIDDQERFTLRILPIDPGVYVFEATAHDALQAGTRDTLTVVVDDPAVNLLPDAIVAQQATALVGDETTLDGTQSTDDDGQALAFLWSQVAGPRAILSDVRAARPTLTPLLAGTYAFELSVDDGLHRSVPVGVAWLVNPREIQPPDSVEPMDDVSSDVASDVGSDMANDVGSDVDRPDGTPGSDVTLPVETTLGDLKGGGCSCQVSSSSSSTPWTLLVLVALGLVGLGARRRRALFGALLVAGFGLVMLPQVANAVESPHGPVALTNACGDCHIGHDSLGDALTTTAGNANLCMSCHSDPKWQNAPWTRSSAIQWLAADQADPTANVGSSHSWSADATFGRFGTSAPTNPQMAIRLEGGTNVMCSTCHDQHANNTNAGLYVSPPLPADANTGLGGLDVGGAYTNPSSGAAYEVEITSAGNRGVAAFRWRKDGGTWTAGTTAASVSMDSGLTLQFLTDAAGTDFQSGDRWSFYASWILRVKMDSGDNATGDKFCRDCHSSWAVGYADTRTSDGVTKNSHPVGEALGANGRGYDRSAPLDGNGVMQGVGADSNPYNDLALDSTNRVQCLTCHGIHYADSNTLSGQAQ